MEFTERFIDNGSVVRKLKDDILIIWLSWPDSIGVGGVLISSTVSMYHPIASPVTDSDLTASLSTNMMNIRDDGVYCMIYAIHPSSRRIHFYKVLGHDVYPIPVITFHSQGEWMDLEY